MGGGQPARRRRQDEGGGWNIGASLRRGHYTGVRRGSVTGRRIINELLPVLATENDSHLTGPVIVSLEGPFCVTYDHGQNEARPILAQGCIHD